MDRRKFLAGSGLMVLPAAAAETSPRPPPDASALPDRGWRLWLDDKASWQDDAIFLPQDVNIAALPVNVPTGGWDRLASGTGMEVTLPATVEQYCWGKTGSRPYTLDEYAWAPRDPVPRNGACPGVSWWWRQIDIPAAFSGRRILLAIRGARLRAEVYLNRKLVGYSILEELPFECDLTGAADPGGKNLLAIRITNPGGRYDWLDGAPLTWGAVKIPRSHGFGGLDRGMTLSAHPMDAHIDDIWVLNTPEPRTAHAFVRMRGIAAAPPVLTLRDEADGRAVAASIDFTGRAADGTFQFTVTAKKAALWSLARPNLYRLAARRSAPDGSQSRRSVAFGFRWFGPDGLGSDALFRLNGRRIKLYSAISWGYWGLNGLWPTSDLAEKEAVQAKAMGLNCLAFHRNVGKEDVFRAQDRLGLLRTMEPGGGKFALGRLPDGVKLDAPSVVMAPATEPADQFCQRFMIAKCVAMVRAFRSHPSLIQYTLQNETGADFSDPATTAILAAMRAEDGSRSIILNDGFVGVSTDPASASYASAVQAWYAPYDPILHRSDREAWGGWWSDHQGAGDQWVDAFYQGPQNFDYRQNLCPQIVAFGEMAACAAPDNHKLMLAEIAQRGGRSYDLRDHRDMAAAHDAFLDRWGFRKAFPKTEMLCRALGRRAYENWQQYMENVRINDATDYAAISGWESTAIENHAGLVDNLRNAKSDPAIIRASLLPVRPLAKQYRLAVAAGESAMFDLYLLNDTGETTRGMLTFAMTDPAGRKSRLGRFPAPAFASDRFMAPVRERFVTHALAREGRYRFSFSLSGLPHATHMRDIWVSDTGLSPVQGRTLRIGVAGPQALLSRLTQIAGTEVGMYSVGRDCSVLVASGTAEEKPVLPPELLAAVRAGTPLLVVAQADAPADALAGQLAAEGAFSYRGQVGRLRAPWMGSWYFLRPHPVYAGLPPDLAMGPHWQPNGRLSNGLLIDGPDVDVFVGYGRDHDRQLGAGTFTTKLGRGKILFQRVPDLNGPLQQRFLRNALAWLCS